LAERRRRAWLVLCLAVALAGCSIPPADLPIVPDMPFLPEAGDGPPEYQVQVGDVLDIAFYLEPELNQEVTVRPDGRFATMLAPEILASGHTVPEITAALRSAYKGELQDPQLSVGVKSFAPMRIYVGGEVANPGEFLTVAPGLTLSQAIARAGGVKPAGSADHVFIIRRTTGRAASVYATRYQDVIDGTDPRADVMLAPFDVVYVPKTAVAQAYMYFNQYVQQFVPVSWGFSYVLNPGTSTVVQSPSSSH
jgi:polysaccharide export outer membrane protein